MNFKEPWHCEFAVDKLTWAGIRLGYLIEIRQMSPKNCPNFQNFSEKSTMCPNFFENFSRNHKKNP